MSSAQIGYFHEHELVHATCGSAKIFLYDIDQVIVDFDLDYAKTFSFIDKSVRININEFNVGHDKQVGNTACCKYD